MPEHRAKSKPENSASSDPSAQRLYESEGLMLQSLRLIAAPNPKDDLTDAELEKICKNPDRSPALVRQLIECIKSI